MNLTFIITGRSIHRYTLQVTEFIEIVKCYQTFEYRGPHNTQINGEEMHVPEVTSRVIKPN